MNAPGDSSSLRADALQPEPIRGAAAPAHSALGALAAAVLVESAFDVVFSLARGTELLLGYLALCSALKVAAALLCVGLASRMRGSAARGALALYALAHGFVGQQLVWAFWLSALAMAATTWIALAPGRLPRLGAAGRGAIVGSALSGAIAIWPYLTIELPMLAYGPAAAIRGIVYALALASATVWEAVRVRGPSAAAIGICALLLCTAGMAIGVERARPQSTAVSGAPPVARAARSPDVFLLVLDTVRADHLSTYGYERETTPNLARFLAEHPEAVQYDLAFSTASWTIPAHGALLSGTTQSVHGARGYSPTGAIGFRADRTLGEVFQAAGYCTVAIVANPYLLRVEGFRRGFEAFYQPSPTRALLLLGEGLRRRFVPWAYAGRIRPQPLADVVNVNISQAHRACATRPAFVLANYMDAHSPYLAPSPHAGLFAGDGHTRFALTDAEVSDGNELVALKRARYDEELHFLDEQLGVLFGRMERDGALRESWLFVTADHGEAFLEHGTTSHGSSIYNEQVRIPLIVKPPRGVELPAARGPVSLLDVATTMAAIAGEGGFGVGRDLRQPLDAAHAVGIEFKGSFRGAERYGPTADDPARAAVRGQWKIIERAGGYELYDLAADPRELHDRAELHADLVRDLVARLPAQPTDELVEEQDDASQNETPAPVRPDEEDALRELGYLD